MEVTGTISSSKMPNHLLGQHGSLLETLESNGTKFAASYYEYKKLPDGILDWAFKLLEDNMREMYENCEWGWNPKDKLKELTSRKAQFLIASRVEDNGEKTPVGFVHFRYDMDYGRRVLYCYELQLEVRARGHKVGSWLMKLLEIFALQASRPLIVLTVLKANEGAIAFYRKVGYDLDETSPGKSEGRPYFIYSKSISS